MGLPIIPLWKEAPFIRLVIPFIAGIIAEYFLKTDPLIYWEILCCSFFGILLFSCLKLSFRFKFIFIYGLLINILFIGIGGLVSYSNNSSPKATVVENLIKDSPVFIITITQPASIKPKSFKTEASITAIQNKNFCIGPSTNIIVYFRKDSTASPPEYGDRIAFIKSPARIKNIPGTTGFDYVKYCALRNIYFQVFLDPHDYSRLKEKDINWLSGILFPVQKWVITILQTNIPGKKEYGLAEALMIGYKDDLDKQLIRSYSNTGVVHVVAISGLHLGLIYALLKFFCLPLGKKKYGRGLSALIIITGLWLFSLLAGGSPSVLRSAVMFSFIVAGQTINRRASIFNNLAASAFFLLCYDPYWLWDIGFQLSYAALISIVIFMKPIYNLITFENKTLDNIWKLNAVTLAAQILTAPVCIYYFHQFPTLFLITNFIAVPLSSIILMGEIALCGVSFIKIIAAPVGWILSWMLKIMNTSVEALGSFTFSTVTGLDISMLQVLLLYVMISAGGAWLILQHRKALPLALVAGILFMVMRLI